MLAPTNVSAWLRWSSIELPFYPRLMGLSVPTGGTTRHSANTGTSGARLGDRELGTLPLCPAVAAAGGRGPAVHVTVSCRAEGCKSIWYKPRHEPEGGHMLLFISLGTIELP